MSKKAEGEVEMTEEQKKLMRTQDIKYVEMKRVAEANVSIFNDRINCWFEFFVELLCKAQFIDKHWISTLSFSFAM